ncbi:MAG: hypothetical protein ACHQ53_02395 [Polyangiales bacterium]
MTRRSKLVMVVVLGSAACGGGGGTPSAAAPEPAPAPAATQPPKAAPTPAPAAAAAPSDRVDDPSFELAALPAGPYAAGKLGSFAVSLKPRGVYHVNQEYPMSVSVHGDDGVSFPKADLAKSDAAAFGEKAARFEVPFTAAKAGDHKVEAKVRFAVCTPENCVPDERTLALMLPVK